MKKMNNIVIVALCVAILGVLLMGCGKIQAIIKKLLKTKMQRFLRYWKRKNWKQSSRKP